MKRRGPYSASYGIGRELVGAGCPLDYLESLPGNPSATRKLLYVRQAIDYAESQICDVGYGSTTYVIRLAIGTDNPAGIVIADWNFFSPWGHHVNWDYDPRDVLPEREHHIFQHLFDSRLSAVLNERRILARGYPVEGLLCGVAFEQIPETFAHGETVNPKLALTVDTGEKRVFRLSALAYRNRLPKTAPSKRRGSLFEKPDLAEQTAVCKGR